MSKARRAEGFTLLELLVVSVLIAIMLALAVPRVQGLFFNDPLTRSARLLVSAINNARGMALTEEQGAVLLVDLVATRIEIKTQHQLRDRSRAAAGETVTVQLDDSIAVGSVWTLSRGRSRTGKVPVWINKRGMIEPVVIELREGDRIISVRAAPFLAEVEVLAGAISDPDPLLASVVPPR